MTSPQAATNSNPTANLFRTDVGGHPTTQGDGDGERVSLRPLGPEEVLKALLSTPAPSSRHSTVGKASS